MAAQRSSVRDMNIIER